MLSLELSLAPEKSQFCVFDRRPTQDVEWSIDFLGKPIANSANIYCTWTSNGSQRFKNASQSGTNLETLLIVHKGLIRAILEWGAILLAGSAKRHLKELDRVQATSLRIILGCMRITPIPILMAEANESALNIRREILFKRGMIRICSWRHNPIAPRLKLLCEKADIDKKFPKYVKNFPLIRHFKDFLSVMNWDSVVKRPGYFDHPWMEIAHDFGDVCDTDTGFNMWANPDPHTSFTACLQKIFPG